MTFSAEAEESLIPLSALQHYLFCPRQCALIHVEQAWAENARTAEGRLLHERVDAPGAAARGGVRTLHGLAIRSFRLGVSGRADAVEMRGDPPAPFPVEYKRGRPKSHRADEVQLCAQAICLEEMFTTEIAAGALFYGETRRRKDVAFVPDLRALTMRVAADVRAMIGQGRTPPPVPAPHCGACSLVEICQPDRLARPPHVAAWLARQLAL